MNKKKKLAIIGVGLMGGGLACAAREKFKSIDVWGYARSRKSYNKLKRLRILDKVSCDLEEVVRGADLVALSLPVYTIVAYFKKIRPFLKKEAIVFDLGSSKEAIERAARKDLKGKAAFVGCHPLCGSEKTGAENACGKIYDKAICLITANKNHKASITIKKFWQKLGCRVMFVDGAYHDKLICAVSHMPHLVSFSLTASVAREYARFVTPSLRDSTRISDACPALWADIFFSNKRNLLRDIKKYVEIINKFKTALEKGNRKRFVALIEEVNARHKFFSNPLHKPR